jgi:hypothetical protein
MTMLLAGIRVRIEAGQAGGQQHGKARLPELHCEVPARERPATVLHGEVSGAGHTAKLPPARRCSRGGGGPADCCRDRGAERP